MEIGQRVYTIERDMSVRERTVTELVNDRYVKLMLGGDEKLVRAGDVFPTRKDAAKDIIRRCRRRILSLRKTHIRLTDIISDEQRLLG